MSAPNEKSMLHHRMPIAFGPFPGPRQSFNGFPRNGAETKSVEAFITITTPKSELLDVLPPGFSFQNQDQNAWVSIVFKRPDNLEWLGGRGYNILSVWVHGVRYIAPDGKQYQGTYIPVLWEDMADAIISGREELGYPKLFADIKTSWPTEDSFSMAASWQGSRFAEFDLSGLQEVQSKDMVASFIPPQAGIDQGFLVWRYVPSVGRPGAADAEYPVFVPHAGEVKRQQVTVTRRLAATHGTFQWRSLDWQALPTMHHIVSRLASVGTSNLEACGLVDKIGGGDMSSARRIDGE